MRTYKLTEWAISLYSQRGKFGFCCACGSQRSELAPVDSFNQTSHRSGDTIETKNDCALLCSVPVDHSSGKLLVLPQVLWVASGCIQANRQGLLTANRWRMRPRAVSTQQPDRAVPCYRVVTRSVAMGSLSWAKQKTANWLTLLATTVRCVIMKVTI
jgi:hypothetical protein